jgi:hypothetical protein
MIRYAPALVAALCLSPVRVHAQGAHVTVSAPSVEIRKGPSVANPVIGHARQGAVLEITRDVGDWYKIAWPEAEGGVGYVRKSAARPADARGTAAAGALTIANGTGPAARSGSAAPAAQLPVPRAAARTTYIAMPSHALGIGAIAGGPAAASEIGVGISARAWAHRRLGFQLEISRYALTSTLGPGEVRGLHVAPSALYTLPSRVSGFVWLRPYVGAGAHIGRATLSGITPGVETSDSGFGMQVFGGGELTMANVPRLAMSADVGYRWPPELFTGFDGSGISLAFGAHWYVR